MKDLLERIQGLWNSAKSAPSKTRAHFPIPRTHVDNGERLGPCFTDKVHYFQLLINQMFLADERAWFVHYDPMVFVASSYIYGTKIETSPFVVGPAMLERFGQKVPLGTIFKNTPVSGMHPYQGGALTLTIILNKLERQNNAERLLKLVEGVSSAIDVSTAFSAYLKIAGTIVDGVEAIFGLSQTVPLLGFHTTINPQVGQIFEPTYFVLIDADEREIKQEWFWVKDSQLHYGPKLENAQPYRQCDFILLQLAQGDKRNDERSLSFYPLWEKTRDLAAQASNKHFWDETKAHFNTLKRALLNSPDLTRPDYTRLKEEYLAEMKNLRTEAANEANLGDRGKLDKDETEMQRIAAELDDLDQL
ncbi:MAG: hypothetical protein HY695_32240 [Deltaproteobacteria bacterium]|nr:hypothetical protein [Deltaproteobacteria bacterium]